MHLMVGVGGELVSSGLGAGGGSLRAGADGRAVRAPSERRHRPGAPVKELITCMMTKPPLPGAAVRLVVGALAEAGRCLRYQRAAARLLTGSPEARCSLA